MAWEKRGNSQYYYSGERVNGRVVKTYHGNGEVARVCAEDAVLAKILEKKYQLRAQRDKDSLDELDRGVAEQAEIAELMARLALVEQGFHLHQRGEWRKRRRSGS